MFTRKELDIVQALLEEEAIKVAESNDASCSGVLEQYLGSLSGIAEKIGLVTGVNSVFQSDTVAV